jgi:hypothetical protein
MLPAAIHAMVAPTVVALNASLAVSTLFLCNFGVPSATVPLDCEQVFSSVRHHTHSERLAMPREQRSLHRSLYALDEYRRLPWMPLPCLQPSAVARDHGLVRGSALGEYSLWCTCRRTPFCWTLELWIAEFPMTEQGPHGKARLVRRPSSLDASTLPSRYAVTHRVMEATAAVIRGLVHDPFECREKSGEPLGACAVNVIRLLPGSILSTTTKAGGFVIRKASIICRDKCSEA